MTLSLDGTSGVTAPVGAVYNGLQMPAAQSSTGGTSIEFLSIPLWAKRITVILQGVSTSGTSPVQMQIGSGAYTTSGYLGGAFGVNASGGSVFGNNYTSGLVAYVGSAEAAAAVRHGTFVFYNVTGNNWVGSGTCSLSNTTFGEFTNTSVSLSGSLDRIRVTTINGTDTFDAGTINIMYE